MLSSKARRTSIICSSMDTSRIVWDGLFFAVRPFSPLHGTAAPPHTRSRRDVYLSSGRPCPAFYFCLRGLSVVFAAHFRTLTRRGPARPGALLHACCSKRFSWHHVCLHLGCQSITNLSRSNKQPFTTSDCFEPHCCSHLARACEENELPTIVCMDCMSRKTKI